MQFRRAAAFTAILLALSSLSGKEAEARRPSTYEKALVAIDKHQYREGIEHLNKLIERNPGDADLYCLLAKAYMGLDNYAECQQAAERSIELDPKENKSYSFRAYCFLRKGDLKRGIADLTKALDLYKLDPFDRIRSKDLKNRAEAYRRLGYPEKARADSARAHSDRYFENARDLREKGRLEDATNAIDQGLKIDPDNPDLWFFRGVLSGNKRQFWTAVADFTAAQKLSPQSAVVYYFRGDCYQQLGRHEEAIADYDRALQLAEKIVAFDYVCETGRLRDQLLRIDGVFITPADVRVLRAQSLIALKRAPEAMEELNTAIAYDPQDNQALSRRAEIVMESGKIETAIKDYTKAIKNSPSDWSLLKQRADAYFRAGRYDEAITDLEAITRLNKKDPGAHLLLAGALANAGKLDRADAAFTEVIRLNPNDDDAYLERARWRERKGRHKEAIDDYTKAEQLNADNAEASSAGRARIYAAGKDDENARQELDRLKASEKVARKGEQSNLIAVILSIALVGAAGLVFLRLFARRKVK